MSGAPPEEKNEKSAPPSGKGNTLVIILSLVNLIAIGGIGGVLYLSFQKEKNSASVEDISASDGQAEEKSGEGHSSGHGEAHGGGEHGGGGHGGSESSGGHGGGHGEGHGGGHGEGEKKNTSQYGRMITLDQFTVNLATPGVSSSKFVRVNISIEVETEDSEVEATTKMPKIRNIIIDLFNSKRPVELATVEGREYLKEEIKNALNSFLVTGKVKGVYFTNFALSS